MYCLLCKSDRSEVFAQVESFGYPLVYYQCQNCGLVFQSAEESLTSNPEFYQETYRRIYQTDVEPTKKDLWVQEKRAAHLIGLLKAKEIKQNPKILDIGASTGLLLQYLRDALNGEVMGVEPGDAYRAYAESQGIAMASSLDELIEKSSQRYDIVTIMHVLEHFQDPVGTLQMIRDKLIAPDGILLLEVPNFYVHDSYELAHLSCFTPHTLKEVVRQAGFQVGEILLHGVPRSSALKLYMTLMAAPAAEGKEAPEVKFEQGVGLKRIAGMLYRRLIQKLLPHQAWLPLPQEKDV